MASTVPWLTRGVGRIGSKIRSWFDWCWVSILVSLPTEPRACLCVLSCLAGRLPGTSRAPARAAKTQGGAGLLGAVCSHLPAGAPLHRSVTPGTEPAVTGLFLCSVL